MARLTSPFVLIAAGVALAAAGSSQAASSKATKLYGQTGPGYTIVLAAKYNSHKRITSLKAGRYTLEIQDRTTSDDFHLVGPGVNKKTGVGFLGGVQWKLTFRKGTYQYYSDVHRSLMHGSFKVT